jgi:hypothetical protein
MLIADGNRHRLVPLWVMLPEIPSGQSGSPLGPMPGCARSGVQRVRGGDAPGQMLGFAFASGVCQSAWWGARGDRRR